MYRYFSVPRNLIGSFFLIALLLVSVNCQQTNNIGNPISKAEIYYDNQEKAIVFAAEDLVNILDKMETTYHLTIEVFFGSLKK